RPRSADWPRLDSRTTRPAASPCRPLVEGRGVGNCRSPSEPRSQGMVPAAADQRKPPAALAGSQIPSPACGGGKRGGYETHSPIAGKGPGRACLRSSSSKEARSLLVRERRTQTPSQLAGGPRTETPALLPGERRGGRYPATWIVEAWRSAVPSWRLITSWCLIACQCAGDRQLEPGRFGRLGRGRLEFSE